MPISFATSKSKLTTSSPTSVKKMVVNQKNKAKIKKELFKQIENSI